MPIVDIPDVGTVEFPDTMSEADIGVAADSLWKKASGEKEAWRAHMREQQATGAETVARAVDFFGALNSLGMAARGAAVDVMAGKVLPTPDRIMPQFDNFSAAATNDPLPDEAKLTPVQKGLADAVEQTPTLAASMAVQSMGIPAPAAFGVPMAGTTLSRTGDPVEAMKSGLLGAVIPGVGELGRQQAAKALTAAVERGWLSGSTTTAQKAVEALGAQTSIQALMEGMNVPQYLAMKPEERKDAIIRSLASNTAFLALDVPAVLGKGPSKTQEMLPAGAKVGHIIEKVVNDPAALDALQQQVDAEALRVMGPENAQEKTAAITKPDAVDPLTAKTEAPKVVESGAETITGSNEQKGSVMPAEVPSTPNPTTPLSTKRNIPKPTDRPWDVLDELEAHVGKFDPALIKEANPNWKPNGAVRMLFRKGGVGADQALNALTFTGDSYGISKDTPLDQFGEMLNAAAEARRGAREQAKREKVLVREDAKQFEQFQSKVLNGERPKKEAGKVEKVPVGHLMEGDTFKVQGHEFEVKAMDFDEDGYITGVTLKDGPKFGTQKIDGNEFIHFDKGSLDVTKRPDPLAGWPEAEAMPAKAPKLGAGETQGDLVASTQREDLKLVGDQGVDQARVQAEQAAKAKADAEAKAIQDQQQGNLFNGAEATIQQATLPRQINNDVTVPDHNTGAPVALADVRKYLAESLDIPVRLGVKVKGGVRKALGLFMVKPETIRMRALNDIPTLAHEVGHYLHYLLFPGGKAQTASDFARRFDGELMTLGQRTSRASYAPDRVRREGVAEFLREWMTDRAGALAKAPNFTAHFEAEVQAKYPETWEVLNNARKMLGDYINQPGAMKVRSMISRTPEDTKVPLRERLEKLYDNWVNDLQPIDRALDKLKDFGLNPKFAQRVSDYAVNYIGGWRGKVEHDLRYAQIDINGNTIGPGLKQILHGVESLEDFGDYLVAKRAIEKNAQGKQTGIDSRDAGEVVKLFAQKYESKRQELLRFQHNNLALLRDSGIISTEQMIKMERMNQDYVPFYRVQESVGGGGGTRKGEGFVNTGQGVGRFKGSDRQIIDPLESVVKNTYVFRDLAERNRIARLFVGAVDQTQGGGRVAEEIARKMKPVQVSDAEVRQALTNAGFDAAALDAFDADLTFKIWRAAKQSDAKDGIFSVWKNGKEQPYQLSDPELYRSLTLADATDAAIFNKFPLLAGARQFTRALRAGATLTLEFVGRNPFRDQITAGVYSKYGFVPFFDGFKGMLSALGKDQWYQDWVRSGGRYADLVAMDRTNLQETLQSVVKDPTMLQKALNLANPLSVIHNLQAASEVMEAATRIAEFRRAKEAGATDIEAANASKDVTLNFSRGGFKGKALNQLVAFFNAQVQDMDKFVRAHQERPLATTAKAFMYISLPSMLTWFLGKDDPEIQKLPEWRKNFFWNVNLGGMTDGDKFILTVPKPFLLGQIYGSSIERGLDYATKRDPNAVRKWFANTMEQQPITLNNVIPTALKPAIETMANHSFFRGGPLEPQSVQGLPAADRATPTTSLVAKTVARMVPEGLEMSPIKIDNLVRGYLGGLGKYGTDAVDYLAYKSGVGDLPPPPSKDLWEQPFFRAFRQSPYESSAYVERFYNGMKRAEERMQLLQKSPEIMTSADLQKQIRENGEDYAYYLMQGGRPLKELRQAQEGLSAIAKAMRMIQNSRDMSGEEKRQKLIDLSAQRDAIAEGAFQLLSPGDKRKVF